jgi:hypothetical protein
VTSYSGNELGLNVSIDFTFLEECLPILNESSTQEITKITSHEAAKGIHNHALRYNNTNKRLVDFWRDLLFQETKKGGTHFQNILDCIDFIKVYIPDFNEAFRELEAYLPPETNISTNLYCIIGYDIGVVSDGDAYLNLAHPLYHESKRELLYFAMHELHHVVYTHYNPTFSFNEIKTTKDLSRIIKYSTHLEGMAVYSAWHKRQRENGYTHRDYITLHDPSKMDRLITRYFDLLNRIELEPVRGLVEDDWSILEVMSDRDRLWYVVGAFMADSIDRYLGREILNSTIIEGYESFFRHFKTASKTS